MISFPMHHFKKAFWLLPLLCLLMTLVGHAQDGCENPPTNVEATPAPTPTPGPKAWDSGSGIGAVLGEDGKPIKNEDGTDKLDGRMTAPQDQTLPQAKWKRVFVAPGAQVPCAVESASDFDHWKQASGDPCKNDPEGVASDSVSYKWTATSGTFDSDSSTSATWTAPTQPGSYTLTCTMDDLPTPVTAPETGDRNDGTLTQTCVVEVTNLAVTSQKPTICAGGVASEAHESVITATVQDAEGHGRPGIAVTFSVENSDDDYPASLSATSATTDDKGEAHVTLISSTLVAATAIVKAEADGMKAETSAVTMGEAKATWGDITPEELIADGESQADVPVSLTFGSDKVDGHSLSWNIIQIYDDKNKLIYDSSNPTLSTMPGEYGSISTANPAESPLGTYHGTYTVGTQGGTVVFQYTDETVYKDDPNATQSAPLNSTRQNGPLAAPTPKLKKTHPLGNNRKDLKPMVFKVYVTPSWDYSPGGSSGELIGFMDTWSFRAIVRVCILKPGIHPPTIDPLTLTFERTPTNGGAKILVTRTARLVRDGTNFPEDAPKVGIGGTIWTYRMADWDVTKEFGEWHISVKDQQKVEPTDFLVNKRGQITTLANKWAGLGLPGRIYPPNSGPGQQRFGDCGEFASYIYGRVGISISMDYATSYGQATIFDNGDGGLLYYYTSGGAISHVGIMTSPTDVVDNNRRNLGEGPRFRERLQDCDPRLGALYGAFPQPRSVPDPYNSTSSILDSR